MNEATQKIDAEIKAERQARPIHVNYGGSLECTIQGYSPMADKLLSMKLDDLRNGTDLTTEYLHSMVADYIFDRLEGNYDDDGHRVNSLLVEQIGFGGIEELAGEE